MLGGLYHPAFREIVEGILFRREMEKRIKEKGSYRVYAAPNAVSKAAGSASQSFGGLLPKHPANGVAYVGLTASVWTHNSGETLVKRAERRKQGCGTAEMQHTVLCGNGCGN